MKHAMITGGADGIGRALTVRLLAAGYQATVLDRDVTKLEELRQQYAPRLRTIALDLASRPGLVHALDELATGLPIDVLVHNAGISAVGRFTASPLTPVQHVIDVNLAAPLLLTAGLLQRDVLAQHATIVLMSSLSHYASYPGAAVYAATKDGLTAYGRSLSAYLLPRGGRVLTVFPGPTRTDHARRYSPDNTREGRRMAPEALADAIYVALNRKQRILIPGGGNRIAAILSRIVPGMVERLMRRTLLDRFEARH